MQWKHISYLQLVTIWWPALLTLCILPQVLQGSTIRQLKVKSKQTIKIGILAVSEKKLYNLTLTTYGT